MAGIGVHLPGIGVQLARNACSPSPGIGVQDRPEYALRTGSSINRWVGAVLAVTPVALVFVLSGAAGQLGTNLFIGISLLFTALRNDAGCEVMDATRDGVWQTHTSGLYRVLPHRLGRRDSLPTVRPRGLTPGAGRGSRETLATALVHVLQALQDTRCPCSHGRQRRIA